MGFINETTVSLADFITKLDTFLVSEGWTSDELDLVNGEWGISRDTVFFQAQWDVSSPRDIGIYQSLGFIGTGTTPGNQTDDSGNGVITTVDATLSTGRFARIDNNPTQYWAFTSNSAPHYFHVILQRATATNHSHFGAGIINKIGDWTGGEYVFGQRTQFVITSQVAVLAGSTNILDGLSSSAGGSQPSDMEAFVATMHIEGMPNQLGGASGRWAIVSGQTNGTFGTDRSSTARNGIIGGFRGSFFARAFGRFPSSPSTGGLLPMYPIGVWYEDETGITTSLDSYRLIGFQQDVRGLNMEFFESGDIVEVGGDDWYIFPSYAKWSGSGSSANTSDYQGIAYRRI